MLRAQRFRLFRSSPIRSDSAHEIRRQATRYLSPGWISSVAAGVITRRFVKGIRPRIDADKRESKL
jgi:hypothetical protein